MKWIILILVILFSAGCAEREKYAEYSDVYYRAEYKNREYDQNEQYERTQRESETRGSDEYEDGEWALWLINATNPMPYDYVPELSRIGYFNGEERQFDSRAAGYAIAMIQSAAYDGITLIPVSSYRRRSTQTENFKNFYNSLLEKGYTQEDAFELTKSQIAVPGTSEHNAGLAIDFNYIEEDFDKTAEFAWLRDNAHKFGFILRYPPNKTHITGVMYEPWHFRYVGVEHAERINNSDLTLEEYTGVNADDNSAVEEFRRLLS